MVTPPEKWQLQHHFTLQCCRLYYKITLEGKVSRWLMDSYDILIYRLLFMSSIKTAWNRVRFTQRFRSLYLRSCHLFLTLSTVKSLSGNVTTVSSNFKYQAKSTSISGKLKFYTYVKCNLRIIIIFMYDLISYKFYHSAYIISYL